MMIHTRIALFVAFSAACAVFACVPAFAQAPPAADPVAPAVDTGMVTLTIFHPERVGYAAEIRFEHHETFHYRYSKLGTLLKQYEVRNDVSADMIVRTLSVNDDGGCTKYRVFVKSLHATREYPKTFAQLKKMLLPPPSEIHCQGATVIISEEPKRSFSRSDGRALTPADIRYLELFFPSSAHRDKKKETALDPDHQVGVGDSWTPDNEIVQYFLLRRSGLEIEPGTMDASETFTDRSTVAGVDAATITLQLNSDSVTMPNADEKLNDPSGTLSATLAIVVPVDAAAPGLGEHLHATLDYSGLYKQENLEGVEYALSSERDISQTTLRILH